MQESSTDQPRRGLRFPIRAKIMLSFSVIFLLIIALFLFSYNELNRARILSQNILPYTQQVDLLNQLSYSIDSLETQIDTFITTPYEQYWSRAEHDLDKMTVDIARLGKMSASDSAQLAQLSQIQTTLDNLDQQTDILFTKIANESERSVAKSSITNHEISHLYELIRKTKQQFKDFLLDNAQSLQQSSQTQQAIMEQLLNRNIVISMLVLALAVTTSLFVSESISRPVRLLKKGTEAFANGEKDIQVEITSNDEIGDLAQSFNQMTETLETQEKHLDRSRKMEAIGLMAGGVAHDLNNVLTGIVGFPDLLLMKMKADDPNRKMVEAIQASGSKAAAIVEDLLTLARRAVPINETVNLNGIVSEYIESPEYQQLVRLYPHIRFENDAKAIQENILGSPVHFRKMLMNLVNNAAEAQNDAGTVRIITENLMLSTPLPGYQEIVEGHYVKITVEDQGHGIAEEDKERIFEPFFTKKFMGRSGTGLGMSVVLGTVEDYKGYITVDSKIGKGTTFSVYFPVTDAAAPENTADEVAENLQGNQEKILIVDDLENQRNLGTQLLKSLNYNVHSLSSGEQAIEYLQTHQADLILLDMIMEGSITGYETYQQIHRKNPEQKVVILSGYAESNDVQQALKLGAQAFLKKPYRREDIAKTVQKTLAG